MKSEEIVSQVIAAILASKNADLRIAAHEQPERTMTLEEVAYNLDQALQEVSQALMDASSDEDQDERSEQSSWWHGYAEGHPYDWRNDVIPEEGYLSRVPRDND